ncbi:hypothetical protein DESC_740019 [Desulfosarcina cetonica]|nr:hypothetical protein DESC_740019 [Desulfosarcina cetonica]
MRQLPNLNSALKRLSIAGKLELEPIRILPLTLFVIWKIPIGRGVSLYSFILAFLSIFIPFACIGNNVGFESHLNGGYFMARASSLPN